MSEENLYTFENPEYRKTYWHTCSHIMAQAVKRLWPEVQLAIGPAIDEGWYYDFDAPFTFTPEHLEKIEAEMKKICKERLSIVRSEKPRQEAIAYMQEKNEPYKVELIEDLPEDAVISFYFGEDVKEADAKALSEEMEDLFDEYDVEVYNGGQPVYDYIISVE